MASLPTETLQFTQERAQELTSALESIRQRVAHASCSQNTTHAPLLVAVSKYKPPGDILACYTSGQRDFGENYVQELVDKAQQLPSDIRWHFIGTLQSNKSKILASIPNLHAIQTLTSVKAADALNRARTDSQPVLHVLLQVNTSGEEAKSGLPPLISSLPATHEDGSKKPFDEAQWNASVERQSDEASDLHVLARHVIDSCPRLRLHGLMTIGALTASLSSANADTHSVNDDFELLKSTRDVLERLLDNAYPQASNGNEQGEGKWGMCGRLALSMGMSSDFEAALHAGSNIVRVGTGIFGERLVKGGS